MQSACRYGKDSDERRRWEGLEEGKFSRKEVEMIRQCHLISGSFAFKCGYLFSFKVVADIPVLKTIRYLRYGKVR